MLRNSIGEHYTIDSRCVRLVQIFFKNNIFSKSLLNINPYYLICESIFYPTQFESMTKIYVNSKRDQIASQYWGYWYTIWEETLQVCLQGLGLRKLSALLSLTLVPFSAPLAEVLKPLTFPSSVFCRDVSQNSLFLLQYP